MFNGQYSGQPVPECQTILNFVAARGVVGGSRGEEQIKRYRSFASSSCYITTTSITTQYANVNQLSDM